MESWSREFLEMMQTLVEGVEQFLTEVATEVEETVEALFDISEELAEQMQHTFETEIEPRINEFFDPILEAYLGFEVAVEDAAQPVVNTVEPLMHNQLACMGCRHYHGQTYNGVMLVCGMHPFGWEGETCPDWESAWQEKE